MKSLKESFKNTSIKIGQLFYLTTAKFYENNLLESINSCAFGFVFSFVPIILITLTVFSGILNAYPALLKYVMGFVDNLKSVVDISPIINQLLTIKKISWIDFFLGLWLIWMARKLFASVMQAVTKIFRSVTQRKNLINQLFIFIFEFVLVIVIIFVVLAIFIFNRILDLPFFLEMEPFIPISLLKTIGSNIALITYSILFIFSTLIFRLGSGVKTRTHICALNAALATSIFYVFSRFIHHFYNPTNYNLVYGTIGSLLVLMMQVWFFFAIFLFFAQMVFATEYREEMSLSFLYLMPEMKVRKNESIWTKFKRNLFRKNPVEITKYRTVKYNPGEIIFREGDSPDYVYYIRAGKVCRTSAAGKSYLKQGAFFGEMHCILNQNRNTTASATTPCVITIIESHEFLEMLHNNPKAATKAISKVSSYTAELYKDEEDEDDNFLKL